MKRLLLTIPSVLFLTSCATGYHSQGFLGDGYSEIVTNSDSFIVTFKGNAYTSREKALRYVLLRASELTTTHGYKYFAVVSSTDQSSAYNYSNTYSDVSGSANTYTYPNHANAQVRGSGSSSTYSGIVVKLLSLMGFYSRGHPLEISISPLLLKHLGALYR